MEKSSRNGIYESYLKRMLDFILSAVFLILFFWLYIVIAVLVRVKIGSPIIFRQIRPGKNETLFSMYKFRTMTNRRDKAGNLLPDEVRLTKFGRTLRETSLDELPEIFCILKGDMSLVGPRPLLVRDMVFMTKGHRKRHTVRPGLTGLAQINGRNDIDWEKKLKLDVQYVKHITFLGDLQIILQTFCKVMKKEGINERGMATAVDYGDYLLSKGKVTKKNYELKQEEARKILKKS